MRKGTVIPFVFVSQPEQHTKATGPYTGAWFENQFRECHRCNWAVRRGALVAHVMMRDPSWHT